MTIDQPEAPVRPERPPRRAAVGCLVEIVQTLVLTLLIFFVVQTFVAQPFRVEQESMRRTLEQNQYVLVDKLTPRWDPYKRGDIIVFNPPPAWIANGRQEPYVKRVIGVGGDTVEIHEGAVFLNGIQLVEPYLFRNDDGQLQETETFGVDTWLIPPGQLFVMGDHRDRSSDSRENGLIDVTDVVGRAWLRYWPIDTFEILPTPTHPELATPAP